MMEKMDQDKSGLIEYYEFEELMKKKLLEEKDIEEEIEKAFHYFDYDGKGWIDGNKLKKVKSEF
jgi:centrin-1